MANASPRSDAAEMVRAARVLDRLRSAAGPSGFLPFDRFMEIALYAEGVGFYHRERSPLGTGGDFYTAAHVHPLFGAAIAARVRAVRRALSVSGKFRIVELGPGDGTLAASVASALNDEPTGVEYVLVERSPARGQEAEERLRAASKSIPVERSDSLAALGPFVGVVLANEFLDAQPARRLRWDGRAWRELGVRLTDTGVESADAESTRAVPGPPIPIPNEPGQIFEVSPAAEGFVREVADHLTDGAAIVIDYGQEESELVRGHSHGTLAGVRDHRPLSDPLEGPGTADLSTFVNFTRLRAVARTSGLAELSFRSQAEALGAWGFPDLLERAVRSASSSEAEVRVRLAGKNLLFGFGQFHALELAALGSAERLREST